MSELLKMLVAAYAAPDPRPFAYEVGQRVRLTVGVVEDVQVPKWWAGAMAEVVSRRTTGIHKEHWYVVRNAQGGTCDFREDEIDRRYARRAAVRASGRGTIGPGRTAGMSDDTTTNERPRLVGLSSKVPSTEATAGERSRSPGPDAPRSTTAYVSKFALTDGVFAAQVRPTGTPGVVTDGRTRYAPGEYHETKTAADSYAQWMIDQRRAALAREVAKLDKIEAGLGDHNEAMRETEPPMYNVLTVSVFNRCVLGDTERLVGFCTDSPGAVGYHDSHSLWIADDITDPELFLAVAIHEALHGLLPDLTEGQVERTAQQLKTLIVGVFAAKGQRLPKVAPLKARFDELVEAETKA